MSDLGFVRRCASGEKRAWDEFVDRYSRLIYSYIHSVIKAKGAADYSASSVEDIFQEVFVLLAKDNFSKLKSFKAQNGCSLASWLRQVVINFTLGYLRNFKPEVPLDAEGEDGLSLKDLLVDKNILVNEKVQLNHKLEQLKECIQKLDVQNRYLVSLHIYDGVSLEALRGMLGISRSGIDMRKARILDKLKDCFKRKGFLV